MTPTIDITTVQQARAEAYGMFAGLLSSPGADPALALPPADLAACLPQGLPYDVDLAPLVDIEVADEEADHLLAQWSTLFEAGGVTSLREEVVRNMASGSKEEVSRFYDHFGYKVHEPLQWQMDHLSIELDFLAYLAATPSADTLRGAADFLNRHPRDFWNGMAWPLVARLDLHPWHRALFESLASFLDADARWLQSTVSLTPES